MPNKYERTRQSSNQQIVERNFQTHWMDNEASKAIKELLVDEFGLDYQLVPPHIHQRNAAERAIRTFKNHFIAGLCSADPSFFVVTMG
jgi:hypothetical protein